MQAEELKEFLFNLVADYGWHKRLEEKLGEANSFDASGSTYRMSRLQPGSTADATALVMAGRAPQCCNAYELNAPAGVSVR